MTAKAKEKAAILESQAEGAVFPKSVSPRFRCETTIRDLRSIACILLRTFSSLCYFNLAANPAAFRVKALTSKPGETVSL